MSSRRESLPGEGARRWLTRFFSPSAMESVFDPFLADLQADWLRARSTRSAHYARWSLLSAYLSLALQIATFAIGSIFGPAYELAPATGSSGSPTEAGVPGSRASRYAAPLVVAALITFALFAVMSALIASQPGEATSDPPIAVTWTRALDPPESIPEPDSVLPTIAEPIPRTPGEGIPMTDSVEELATLPPGPGEGWSMAPHPYITGPVVPVPAADQSEMPIVRVEPVYPRHALDRGIEGWVDVEFTVTEVGSISDPRILRSHPGGIFNRAALRAIERWKYAPKIVDGQPVARPGMRNRFRFELNKAGSRSH
jgi:protein TonB